MTRFAFLAAALLALPAAASTDYVFVGTFETEPDCSAELACPPTGTCISGRLAEAGSGRPLRAYYDADRTCAAGAVGGPCDLALDAYDALQFAQNPATSTPLQRAERTVDGCGRYRFAGLEPPPLGFVAIVADDASVQPEDLFVIDPMLTGTGPSGAALFSMPAQGLYSGAGAEPAGCTWPSANAAVPGGVVLFVALPSSC